MQNRPLLALLRLVGRLALFVLIVLAALWALGAVYYMGGGDRGAMGKLGMTVYLVGGAVWVIRSRKTVWMWLAFMFLVSVVWIMSVQPSNDRDWRTDVARNPTAKFDGDMVTVRNIRNFTYRADEDFDVAYYDKTFDLSKLETGYLWMSYWDGNTAIAHTMLSFGFGGEDYVCLSVEIRREKGESWGAIPGIYRQFEILYVLADERDLINVRTSHRGEEVYCYPFNMPPAEIRQYFVHLLNRCNEIAEQPEFYDSLGYNCTSALTHMGEDLWPDRERPSGLKALLNGYTDEYMYDLGTLRTAGLSFPDLKKRCHVSELGRSLADDPEFSKKIRANLP